MIAKRIVVFVLLLTMAVAAAACGGNGQAGKSPDQTQAPKQSEPVQPEPSSTDQSKSSGGENANLLLGTGSQGGTYFPLGSEMANVWNKNLQQVNVTATETGASVENLAKISRDQLDLGMTVNLTAVSALKGENEFKGNPVSNFAFISQLYPEIMQIVTTKRSGVETIGDLKGKKVAIGPPGSGTQAIAKVILEAYGLKEGDYKVYQEGFGDAKGKLQDGNIDASFGLLGLPEASIEELNAVTKDVKLLEVTGDALKYVQGHSGYTPFTISAGSYEWLKEDVHTVSAYSVLVANTKTVSDDLAYQMTKVLIEHAKENTHPQAKFITSENALKGSEGLPIHPGALKYYKEAGLIK